MASILAVVTAAVGVVGSLSTIIDDSNATCVTSGPATYQVGTTRVGGDPMGPPITTAASASHCAALCCARSPCRSWAFDRLSAAPPRSPRGDANNTAPPRPQLTCTLLSGYSMAVLDANGISGVVYRTEVQPAAWAGIKGFNYVPPGAVNDIDMWVDFDPHAVARDMAIGRAAGFNFCRVFLNYHVWAADPAGFVKNVQQFVATAHVHGIETMPIPFDLCWFGCRDENVTARSKGRCWYPSPQFSLADDRAWWSSHGEPYVDALVAALPAGTPGLKLWDVVNEPETGGGSGLPGERGTRWLFVEHFVRYFQSKSKTPTTVGCASVDSLAEIGPVVDVLTFHSYHPTWEIGLRNTEVALGFARQLGKPVFNSETGCIARANPYDQTVEMATRNGIGFALWELMISDCLDCIDTRRWKHGLMYVDGTTRDPAAIAAVNGVFLNRGDSVGLAVPKPDVEGASSGTIDKVQSWLATNATADFIAGVGLLDTLSSIAESSQTLPLVVPLSGQARRLASEGDTPGSRAALTRVLAAQIGAVGATKSGAETGAGVCEFPGTPRVCTGYGCTTRSDVDPLFEWKPVSTPALYSCWTAATDTPGNGTLHYCNRSTGSVSFSLGREGPQPITGVDLIYKAGPDCGTLSATLNGRPVLAGFDAYGPQVDWAASVSLYGPGAGAAGVPGGAAPGDSDEGGAPLVFEVAVDGEHSQAASNAWVQIVGIQIWHV